MPASDVIDVEIDLGELVDVRAWRDIEATPDPDNPEITHYRTVGEPHLRLITLNSKGQRLSLKVDRELFYAGVDVLIRRSREKLHVG